MIKYDFLTARAKINFKIQINMIMQYAIYLQKKNFFIRFRYFTAFDILS